jgi:hypothetical protein
LVFDLYSIIQAIKTANKVPYNMLGVVLMMREEIKTVDIPEERYSDVVGELFGGSQVKKEGAKSIFETLKSREQKREILEFYKIKVNEIEETDLYEESCRLTDIIYNEKTWDIILETLKSVTEYNPGKPYDFVDFCKAIRNSYIGVFENGSILKEKCKEVSKEIKRFEVS